jgi:hypothetical protein
LCLPPRLLNLVNIEIVGCAWGAFPTGFSRTYDFLPVRERLTREFQAKRAAAKKPQVSSPAFRPRPGGRG